MKNPSPTSSPRHPIAVVVARTGLAQDLLRAWERRYDAVRPARTDSGRRLYSDDDIERLKLIKQALDGGRRIGDVGRLEVGDLLRLCREDGKEPGQAPPTGAGDEAAQLLRSARAALADWDGPAFERALGEASVALALPRLLDRLLKPLLEELGRDWSTGELRPAQEHLATATIRTLLGNLYLRRRPRPGAPALVVGTPQGQRHELGALMAALTAQEAGWDAIYLGPDLPAEELAGMLARRGAKGVALSLVPPVDEQQLGEELLGLRRAIGPERPIWVGGDAALACQPQLDAAGAQRLASLEDLRERLTMELSRG